MVEARSVVVEQVEEMLKVELLLLLLLEVEEQKRRQEQLQQSRSSLRPLVKGPAPPPRQQPHQK